MIEESLVFFICWRVELGEDVMGTTWSMDQECI